MVVLPLCAFGILGVVRPHWAAWGLAISAMILPLATGLIIRAYEGGTPEIWYLLYGIPALLTAGFLRQSIPGSALDRSRAKGPLVAASQSLHTALPNCGIGNPGVGRPRCRVARGALPAEGPATRVPW